jgi:hypothetical protein
MLQVKQIPSTMETYPTPNPNLSRSVRPHPHHHLPATYRPLSTENEDREIYGKMTWSKRQNIQQQGFPRGHPP